MIFQEKFFSCYILLADQISVCGCLDILGYMCIAIISCPVCDVINFEINHNFLVKPFFYITKKSGQKCNYLKNEKNFKHEIKSIFDYF